MIGHVVPEAAERGPIAALADADEITIDVGRRRLDVALTEAQLAERLAGWKALPPRYVTGVLAKYAKLVADASHGAVTDLSGSGFPNLGAKPPELRQPSA